MGPGLRVLVPAGVLAGMQAGCADPQTDTAAGPVETMVYLPVEGWALSTGDDPFAAGRPEDADCSPAAYGEENGFFELESDGCAYAVFTQPLQAAMPAAEPLRFVAWHLALWAEDPATARVVLQVEDEVLWEASFPVPGPAEVQDLELSPARAHPKGAPAFWHVQNHGYNSWRLGDVTEMKQR